MDMNDISATAHYLEHLWDKSDYLRLCDGENSIIVLGYRVRLTKTEYDIVKLLLDSPGEVSAERIVEKCLLHKDVTKGDVALHVYNLNKKVEGITGRRLVVGVRHKGYKIVEHI